MADVQLYRIAYASDPGGAFIGTLVVATDEAQALELGGHLAGAPAEEVSATQITAPPGHALGAPRVLSCLADAALYGAAGWGEASGV